MKSGVLKSNMREVSVVEDVNVCSLALCFDRTEGWVWAVVAYLKEDA